MSTLGIHIPDRSFCWEHRPQQAAVSAPAEDTNCAICLRSVGDRASFSTLVCPACTHTWFHQGCIQLEALNAGTTPFQCPGCGNNTLFRKEMSTLGIHIPDRLVSYGQTMQMTRRDHWAWPQTDSAGLALCCHTSVCLSFMEKGEIWLRRKRWDNVGRPAREENDVDASHLLQRHHRCNAIECFHPKGRDQAEEEG
ncbi:hypothetical protein ASZ78_016564 [Callipepla squamata]|uniref:RING-type domain-containing protein n=1 Tax=Callipepla squamata TaxID=9009 RepID=A0A226MF37_CALSU|nr:hypothetical protein ASZ78_016564 [Callipepla squamata]